MAEKVSQKGTRSQYILAPDGTRAYTGYPNIDPRFNKGGDFTSYYWRQIINGKTYHRSLQTRKIKDALARAKIMEDAVVAQKWAALERAGARSTMPTIDELCDAYLTEAKRRGEPREKTAAGYVYSLKRLLAIAEDVKDAGTLSASILGSEEVLLRYHDKWVAGKQGSELERLQRGVRTSLADCRAMFKPSIMDAYRQFTLPDLTRFRTAFVCPAPSREVLPYAEWEIRILESGHDLKVKNPPLYMAYMIYLHCGLRPVELKALRWDWLEEHKGKMFWHITRRKEEGFNPKGYSGFAPAFWPGFLDELYSMRNEIRGYVLPGTMTNRAKLASRMLGPWMQSQGWTREETQYAFRKYAAQRWKEEYGIETAQDWLRHANSKTTQDNYAGRLNLGGQRVIA